MKITRIEIEIIRIHFNGKKKEQVDKFKYLGVCITDDGITDVEIKVKK